MVNIRENAEEAQFDLEDRYLGHETESHHDLSLVSRYQDIETEFDPEARRRIEQSEGYSDDESDPITAEEAATPEANDDD
jgi:isocitrate lyase